MTRCAQGARVIVVGAGVSGLAAAVRLHQAGHNVTVLESAATIGGKTRTGQRDGFTFEQGAVILPAAYSNFLKIVADVGLGHDLVAGGSVIGFVKPGPGGSGCERFYLDSANLIRDAVRTLIDATLRGVLGAYPDKASVVDFFFAFNNLLGTTLYGLRGGLSRYADAVAALVPIRAGARVLSVLDRGPDVEVVWRDEAEGEHTEHVDGVVVAIPGNQTAGVLPALDPARRDYLSGLDYTPTLSVNVALSQAPAGVPASVMQVPAVVHHGLLGFILEHNRMPEHVPAGKGMLGLLTMPDWSRELLGADDGTVLDEMLAATERVLPGVTRTVEWTQINRWPSALIHSHPGSWRELGEFNHIRKATDRRVQLAGDYFSSTNLNTATTAGERAARELQDVLLTG